MTSELEIARRLDSLAAGIEVRPLDVDTVGRRSVGRRRRRRLGAVAGAVVLAGAAAFVALRGSDESSSIDTVTTPTTVAQLVGTPVVVPGASSPATTTVDPVAPSYLFGGTTRVIGADNGFTLLATRLEAPELPDLDSELVESFPPEIIDVIRASDAATMAEAVAAIEAAGLMDEAMSAVMSEFDTLGFLAGTPVEVILRSADGIAWEPIDAAFPRSLPGSTVVTGDGERSIALGPTAVAWTEDGTLTDVTVRLSDDLIDWRELTLDAPDVADLPDHLYAGPGYAPRWAGWGPAGWVVSLQASVVLRPDLLVLDGLREEIGEIISVGGPVDGGVEYAVLDEEGQERVIVVPWEQLPYTQEQWESAEQALSTATWTGTFDGKPRRVRLPEEECCPVAAGDEGYLAYRFLDGPDAWFSVDLDTWSAVEVPFEGAIASVVGVDGGFVVHELAVDETSTLWWTDGDSWREVRLPAAVADHELIVKDTGGGAAFIGVTGNVHRSSSGDLVRAASNLDPWIIASADGIDWIVSPIPGADIAFNAAAPAFGAGRLLVPAGDEWLVFDLPS